MNKNWGKAMEGARATTTQSTNNSGGGGGGGGGGGTQKNNNIGTTKSRGAMIMKTVSILLASSRRVSNQLKLVNDKVGGNISEGKTKEKYKTKTMLDDSMGKITPKLLDMFKKKTHFSKSEVEALCRIYRKLVSNCHITSRVLAANSQGSIIAKPHATIEGIDRSVFRELLHSTFDIVTEEILMERIFTAWEKGHEGLPLRLEGWIYGLSVFLRGNQSERAAFCFRVYDLNNDGYITKDEMFTLLKNCLIKQPQDEDPDEGVKDLVEIALRKFDIDKDGKVSFQDYSGAVMEEPLLIEAFGQCLPSESATISFLSTLQI